MHRDQRPATHGILERLSADGLVLSGVLPTEDLVEPTRAALEHAGHRPDDHRSLVFLGQAGRLLWDAHVSRNLERADPFDETVSELVADAFATHAPTDTLEIVYPGEAALPLGSLATRVGWGLSSPLGLTIHPTWGLWLAHRIVVLTTLELEPSEPFDTALYPCASCVDTPCVSSCPAEAVSVETGFAVRTCAEHRAPPGSSCEFTCHARLACPVGAEHRYGPDQMRHHYASGLRSIRSWLDSEQT